MYEVVKNASTQVCKQIYKQTLSTRLLAIYCNKHLCRLTVVCIPLVNGLYGCACVCIEHNELLKQKTPKVKLKHKPPRSVIYNNNEC